MKDTKKTTNRIYFLGAGATKALSSQVPLNDEIIVELYKKGARKKYFKVEKEICNIKIFLDNIFHKEKEVLPRIEDVLSFIDYNLQRKEVASVKYDYEYLANIRNDILKIICEMLKKNLQMFNYPIIDNFVKKLQRNDVVISTNYDIVIDNVLEDIGNINYGIKLRKAISFSVNAVNDKVFEEYTKHQINLGKVRLLKLHGSLNWLYCPRCNEIDLTIKDKGVAYLYEGLGLKCISSNCTCLYEPILVTPTKFKIYENRLIKETWSIAKKSISEATEIYFIGYSLPEADIEIRCLLLNGLNEGKRKAKITLVDKQGGSDAIFRYKCLLGKIDYRPIGFSNFVRECI